MKYEIVTWKISDIITAHSENRLDINPPYQRNFIWSINDQIELINSIFHNYPIPNLFLKKTAANKYEIVDGQQRTRTVIAFFNGQFKYDGRIYSKDTFPEFENYLMSIIIITEISAGDISIEEFYGLVNSAGKHLNRPEIIKAEYYDTKFLKLVNTCNSYSNFRDLGLFTDAVLKRMNDIDFVSELLILLKDKITDKKEKVDKTFEADISQAEYDDLEFRFKKNTDTLYEINKIYKIKKTRYKQRNDFYTLFGFFDLYPLDSGYQKYIYQILVLIGEDINPSNDECISFQNYARNCVTQSNSKSARLERQTFLEALFLNQNSTPNSVQRDAMTFYKMLDTDLKQHQDYFTIDLNYLKTVNPSISFNI